MTTANGAHLFYGATEAEVTEAELVNLTGAEREALKEVSAAEAAEAELELLKQIVRKGEGDDDHEFKSDMGADLSEEQTIKNWREDVQHFFARTKEADGVDYTKPLLNVAFDHALKTLAADEANAQRTSSWFLRQAHKLVKADIEAAAEPGGEPQDADGEDGAGGELDFAALDEIEGEEYEAALTRLSPAKAEQYLRSR